MQGEKHIDCMLESLANMPSSGIVWRGPVPKNQVTPSDNPSGWQEPQLLQSSLDILPRKFNGTMSRVGVTKEIIIRHSEAGEEGELAEEHVMSQRPRGGRQAGGGQGIQEGDHSKTLRIVHLANAFPS